MFVWSDNRTVSQNIEVFKSMQNKKTPKLKGNNFFLILRARLKKKLKRGVSNARS